MMYYEGWWEMGMMSRRGEFGYRNGSVYRGEVYNGKKQGFGKYMYVDKRRYEGYWRDGRQEGLGCIYSSIDEGN
jgi:hypothetical protein